MENITTKPEYLIDLEAIIRLDTRINIELVCDKKDGGTW